jgi:hypothetical protein
MNLRHSGPRTTGIAASLLLAVGIHVDYHLARPLHHRLSLEWQQHWIFAVVLFAAVASLVALRWPSAARWRVGMWVLVAGILLAQLVEPVLTVAFYEHRLAYETEPERWQAFLECITAGIPAYLGTLWCAGRWPSTARSVR